MIRREVFDQIVLLLRQPGNTHRGIAARTRTSRSIVALIAAGRHRYQQAAPPDPLPTNFKEDGEIGMCPNGHGMVHLPCLACHVKTLQRQGAIRPLQARGRDIEDGTEQDLKLQLVGGHRQRLDDLRVLKSTKILETAMAGRMRQQRQRRRAGRGQLTTGTSPLAATSTLPQAASVVP